MSRNVERSREFLEDREAGPAIAGFNDSDGLGTIVSPTSPLPVTISSNNKIGVSVSFVNPDNGVNMNVASAFTGTADGVHNGIDSTLWTASTLNGTKFTYNSTDFAHTGSASIKTNKAIINDDFQVLRGSTIDLSGYVALTMFVYVDSGWSAASLDSINIGGYDTGTGLDVGTPVAIEHYFNELDFGEWHAVVIPLDDLELEASTIDALRIEVVAKSGAGPVFYLDDIQFEESGGDTEYEALPTAGTDLYLNSLRFTLADNITALSYDKFMGLTSLTNGVEIALVSDNVVTQNVVINNLGDLIFVRGDVSTKETDATNTIVAFTLPFDEPTVLHSATNDKAVITINDDLSGLLLFKCIMSGYEVVV